MAKDNREAEKEERGEQEGSSGKQRNNKGKENREEDKQKDREYWWGHREITITESVQKQADKKKFNEKKIFKITLSIIGSQKHSSCLKINQVKTIQSVFNLFLFIILFG